MTVHTRPHESASKLKINQPFRGVKFRSVFRNTAASLKSINCKPDFLRDAFDSSRTYMKWEIKGLQENYYYHKNDTLNTPKRLVQGGDDTQDFYEYNVGVKD